MEPMKTIEEIRHTRLMQLLQRPEYPTIQALADKISRSYAQVSQWKNRARRTSGGFATLDSASARHLEECVGLPRGWMDHDPDYDGVPEAAEADWSTLQGAASILRMHAARCEAYCDQIDKQIRALGARSGGSDRERLSQQQTPKKKNFRRRIDDR